ncbi:MAG: glycogen synthase GlgA [Gammaproteobacteria bacterium]
MSAPLRVLLATAELYPLVKTGGLGDAVGALATALGACGVDVRVVLPCYAEVHDWLGHHTHTRARRLTPAVDVIEARLDDGTTLCLVRDDALYARAGGPYTDADGVPWHDNAHRFATFCRAVTTLAGGGVDGWQPDVVHAHDWHAGLVPAFLAGTAPRPACVFNIHSLAHQGQFDRQTFDVLGLDPAWWSPRYLEFYGQWSFMKAALVFADRLVTVSPTYADEILGPAFGCGLEGVLATRREQLHGILNGVDYAIWDPAHDAFIDAHYGIASREHKRAVKRALQHEFALPPRDDAFVIGHVGRLCAQKGSDLIAAHADTLLADPRVQLVVLGSGEPALADALASVCARHPQQARLHVGYSETLAHHVIAGADVFLMPSRFEPCGLTQLYALTYGTLPVVHATGGLVDTVIDVAPATLDDGSACGFVFTPLETMAASVARAHALFRDEPRTWHTLTGNAMRRRFGWDTAARAYLDVYQAALADSSPRGREATP